MVSLRPTETIPFSTTGTLFSNGVHWGPTGYCTGWGGRPKCSSFFSDFFLKKTPPSRQAKVVWKFCSFFCCWLFVWRQVVFPKDGADEAGLERYQMAKSMGREYVVKATMGFGRLYSSFNIQPRIVFSETKQKVI